MGGISHTPESAPYRGRLYIIKDIISLLLQYGEMTQTNLVSFCGLNLAKHKPILDELESKNLVTRSERPMGKKTVSIYKLSEDGLILFKAILEPYETMFPRRRTVQSGNRELYTAGGDEHQNSAVLGEMLAGFRRRWPQIRLPTDLLD